MNYCVVKNTTKVIDGSKNTEERMIQNAKNAGFEENEVEIITKEEYKNRKVLEPVQPTVDEEKLAICHAIADLQERLSKVEGGNM